MRVAVSKVVQGLLPSVGGVGVGVRESFECVAYF